MATLTAVQRRDFSLLSGLRMFSILGDEIAVIALALRLAGHHGATATLSVMALFIVNAIPPVLLAPYAGLVADRVRAKRIVVPLCFVEAAVAIVLGHYTGIGLTLGLVALLATSVAFSSATYTALTPALVGEENAPKAMGTLQALVAVSGFAGPGLGGLLVGATGQHWPLYIDAISYAVCGLGTLLLRGDRIPAVKQLAAKTKGEASKGLRFMFHDGVLRPLLSSAGFVVLVLSVVNVVMIFLVRRNMHGTSAEYGLVWTVFGAGNLIGSWIGSRQRAEAVRLFVVAFCSIAIIGVTIAIIGVMPTVWWSIPLLAVSGLANGPVNVCAMMLITMRSPEELRGRVFAGVNAYFTSVQVTSMAIGGVLATVISPRTIFVVAGVACVAVVAVMGPSATRAVRRATT